MNSTPAPRVRRSAAAVGVVLGALALGVGATWLAARRADRGLRVERLQQARLAAHALSIEHVKELTGTAADLTSPAYRQFKAQLMSIGLANPDCKWFYLMGRKADGTVVFLVDSESPEVEDPSPPGQVYAEVPAGYRRVFDTRTAVVEGPVRDRWGRWFTALVPLLDPEGGSVVAVLGMDVDARAWAWDVAAGAALPAGLTLVLVIGLATAVCVARPLPRDGRRGRAPASPKPVSRRLLLPLAGMVALPLLGAGALLWQQHRQRLDGEIAADVYDALGDLRVALDQQADSLTAYALPIAADVAVQKALRDGDADRLLLAWRPVFDTLHRKNLLTHLYVLDRNRVCLLRVHQPGARGGTVDRFTACEAERTGKVTSGLELGAQGTFALRVVQPIFAGTELVGYAELGQEIGAALQTLHTRSGNHLAVTIRKDRLSRATWEVGLRALGREAEWDRLPKHVVTYASQGRLPDAVVPFAEQTEARGHAHGRVGAEVAADGKRWRISAACLEDASGAAVGDLMILRDITTARAAFARLMTLSGTVGGVLLVLLLSSIYALLRRTDAGIVAQQVELRESETRFAQLAEQSGTVAWEVDPQGLFTYVSEVCATVWGYLPQELTGRLHFYDLHPEAGREGFARETLAAFGRGEPFRNRINPTQRKDGRLVWVATNGIPLLAADGTLQGYRGSDTDITQRQQAEEALRQEQQFVESLLDSLPGIFYLYTYPEHRLVRWNKQHEAFLGFTAAEMKDRSAMDWHLPAAREAVLKATEEVMAKGYAAVESALVAKDGHLVPFFLTGVRFEACGRLYYMGTGTDITERKRAEEQVQRLLAESHQAHRALLGILEDETRAKAGLKRLATAIEQAGEIVVIADPAGIIQYVNPAFEAVTGYSRAEAVGQSMRILKSGKQDEAFYRELWATIASGRVWQGRFVNRRKSGALYTEEATISPVHDAAGRIVNYVAVKRDITEHLRVTVQLQQAQKMEAVGRLAGGVAHDFNNLLTGIMNYIELCRDALSPTHPVRSYLDEIASDARRSADLTRQVLAFARRQIVAPKVLDLNDAVAGMLKLLRRLIGEDIDMAWLPGADLWPVLLDPGQFDQILANLCVNARDAVAGVGKVSIATANATLDAGWCAQDPAAVPGDYVRLTVSDDGCGMDRDTVEHIFEPFFTTKESGKGTGLGLATVYGIVEQNRGHIQVRSEPGAGTTFDIYLPRSAEAVVEAAPAELPEARPRGHETILVVEDEPSVRVTTRRFLELLGYTVLVAGAPLDALSLAAAHPGPIGLLITDVVMPGMSGPDLARTLAEQRPGTKCLFMSGYSATVIVPRGAPDEGVQFLAKPFSRDALARKVREVLAVQPGPPDGISLARLSGL
jgi:PAS domain S-box-containing protein